MYSRGSSFTAADLIKAKRLANGNFDTINEWLEILSLAGFGMLKKTISQSNFNRGAQILTFEKKSLHEIWSDISTKCRFNLFRIDRELYLNSFL